MVMRPSARSYFCLIILNACHLEMAGIKNNQMKQACVYIFPAKVCQFKESRRRFLFRLFYFGCYILWLLQWKPLLCTEDSKISTRWKCVVAALRRRRGFSTQTGTLHPSFHSQHQHIWRYKVFTGLT